MTNTEMAQLFINAQDEDFITGLFNQHHECNSECEDCPASPACEQLAEDKDFAKFSKNYNTHIVPILKELTMRCANTEALNSYMDEVEAGEKATESFLDAIASELEIISDAVWAIKQISKGYEPYDMDDILEEAINESIQA